MKMLGLGVLEKYLDTGPGLMGANGQDMETGTRV